MAELLTKKKKLAMDRERKLMDLIVRALMVRLGVANVVITAGDLNAVLARPTYYLLNDDFSVDVTLEDEHVKNQ